MNYRVFATLQLPMILYCLVALGSIAQGVRYLGGDEIADYHESVIATPWENIAPNYQRLLLGLYKGFGAGFLCVGLTIIVLVFIPFRAGDRWAVWATPGIAGVYWATLAYVTSSALLPGANPIALSRVALGIVVLAAALSYFRNEPAE